MLEPQPIFKSFQFVQEIAFKNKDLHRSDLGIERFGFVKRSHIIERVHCEYEVCFTTGDDSSFILEYSLRPLTENEIQERLSYIANHADKFTEFIQLLNSQPELQAYHINPSSLTSSIQLSFT